MGMVHVAIFIFRGVLNGIEVFADPEEAQAKANEWRRTANPEEDVVEVLEKEVIVTGTPVSELRLSTRASRALRINRIRTVEQLVSYTPKLLLLKRRIGHTTLQELKDALKARGLSLAED